MVVGTLSVVSRVTVKVHAHEIEVVSAVAARTAVITEITGVVELDPLAIGPNIEFFREHDRISDNQFHEDGIPGVLVGRVGVHDNDALVNVRAGRLVTVPVQINLNVLEVGISFGNSERTGLIHRQPVDLGAAGLNRRNGVNREREVTDVLQLGRINKLHSRLGPGRRINADRSISQNRRRNRGNTRDAEPLERTDRPDPGILQGGTRELVIDIENIKVMAAAVTSRRVDNGHAGEVTGGNFHTEARHRRPVVGVTFQRAAAVSHLGVYDCVRLRGRSQLRPSLSDTER